MIHNPLRRSRNYWLGRAVQAQHEQHRASVEAMHPHRTNLDRKLAQIAAKYAHTDATCFRGYAEECAS